MNTPSSSSVGKAMLFSAFVGWGVSGCSGDSVERPEFNQLHLPGGQVQNLIPQRIEHSEGIDYLYCRQDAETHRAVAQPLLQSNPNPQEPYGTMIPTGPNQAEMDALCLNTRLNLHTNYLTTCALTETEPQLYISNGWDRGDGTYKLEPYTPSALDPKLSCTPEGKVAIDVSKSPNVIDPLQIDINDIDGKLQQLERDAKKFQSTGKEEIFQKLSETRKTLQEVAVGIQKYRDLEGQESLTLSGEQKAELDRYLKQINTIYDAIDQLKAPQLNHLEEGESGWWAVTKNAFSAIGSGLKYPFVEVPLIAWGVVAALTSLLLFKLFTLALVPYQKIRAWFSTWAEFSKRWSKVDLQLIDLEFVQNKVSGLLPSDVTSNLAEQTTTQGQQSNNLHQEGAEKTTGLYYLSYIRKRWRVRKRKDGVADENDVYASILQSFVISNIPEIDYKKLRIPFIVPDEEGKVPQELIDNTYKMVWRNLRSHDIKNIELSRLVYNFIANPEQVPTKANIQHAIDLYKGVSAKVQEKKKREIDFLIFLLEKLRDGDVEYFQEQAERESKAIHALYNDVLGPVEFLNPSDNSVEYSRKLSLGEKFSLIRQKAHTDQYFPEEIPKENIIGGALYPIIEKFARSQFEVSPDKFKKAEKSSLIFVEFLDSILNHIAEAYNIIGCPLLKKLPGVEAFVTPFSEESGEEIEDRITYILKQEVERAEISDYSTHLDRYELHAIPTGENTLEKLVAPGAKVAKDVVAYRTVLENIKKITKTMNELKKNKQNIPTRMKEDLLGYENDRRDIEKELYSLESTLRSTGAKWYVQQIHGSTQEGSAHTLLSHITSLVTILSGMIRDGELPIINKSGHGMRMILASMVNELQEIDTELKNWQKQSEAKAA